RGRGIGKRRTREVPFRHHRGNCVREELIVDAVEDDCERRSEDQQLLVPAKPTLVDHGGHIYRFHRQLSSPEKGPAAVRLQYRRSRMQGSDYTRWLPARRALVPCACSRCLSARGASQSRTSTMT